MQAEGGCRTGRQHQLVHALGVGHMSGQQGHPVGREVLAARAAFDARRRFSRDPRDDALSEHLQGAVEPDDRDCLLHTRDPRHCPVHACRISRPRNGDEVREELHVRRVRAGEVCGEGGLGPACARHGRHGDATHQADEHDEGEITAPAMAEGGPEAVPRFPHDRSDHASSSMSSAGGAGDRRPARASLSHASVAVQVARTKVATLRSRLRTSTPWRRRRRRERNRHPWVRSGYGKLPTHRGDPEGGPAGIVMEALGKTCRRRPTTA